MTQPDAARVERGPITEVKRFALGMADLLERQGFTIAAAELRRLHAQREALLEALRLLNIECHQLHHNFKDRHDFVDPCPVVARIKTAIKAAEENT